MAHPPFTTELSRLSADGTTWHVVPLAKTFDMIATDDGFLEFEVPWASPDRVAFCDSYLDVHINQIEVELRVVFPKGCPPLRATMAVAEFRRIDNGREGDRARVRLQCINPTGGWPCE